LEQHSRLSARHPHLPHRHQHSALRPHLVVALVNLHSESQVPLLDSVRLRSALRHHRHHRLLALLLLEHLRHLPNRLLVRPRLKLKDQLRLQQLRQLRHRLLVRLLSVRNPLPQLHQLSARLQQPSPRHLGKLHSVNHLNQLLSVNPPFRHHPHLDLYLPQAALQVLELPKHRDRLRQALGHLRSVNINHNLQPIVHLDPVGLSRLDLGLGLVVHLDHLVDLDRVLLVLVLVRNRPLPRIHLESLPTRSSQRKTARCLARRRRQPERLAVSV
jgi:hypothetical protein